MGFGGPTSPGAPDRAVTERFRRGGVKRNGNAVCEGWHPLVPRRSARSVLVRPRRTYTYCCCCCIQAYLSGQWRWRWRASDAQNLQLYCIFLQRQRKLILAARLRRFVFSLADCFLSFTLANKNSQIHLISVLTGRSSRSSSIAEEISFCGVISLKLVPGTRAPLNVMGVRTHRARRHPTRGATLRRSSRVDLCFVSKGIRQSGGA